jgi:hypothetical protein
MIYRGYEVGDDEETEGKKAGVDALLEEHDKQSELMPYHETSRGHIVETILEEREQVKRRLRSKNGK